MNQLKVILYIFGIPILLSELFIYFFYYFNLYSSEFLITYWVLHLSVFVILNGILHLSGLRNFAKNFKITAGIFFCLAILMLFGNIKRNEHDLKINGTKATGYVVNKYKSSRSSWNVIYHFEVKNKTYKAELSIYERSKLDKIAIGDSAKIRYSTLHPKINEVINQK